MSVDPQTQSLLDAILAVNYDRVKSIVTTGVAINTPNDLGQTPLAVACHRGNLEIVDLLIAAGAKMQADPDPVEFSPPIAGDKAGSANLSKLGIGDRENLFDNIIDLIYESVEDEPNEIEQFMPISDLQSSLDRSPSVAMSSMNVDRSDISADPISSMNVDRSDISADPISSIQDISADREKFHTFDLDEVFAIEATADISTEIVEEERFIGRELTKPYLHRSNHLEGGETYVFDLSSDLERLTVEANEAPEQLSIPMGEWDANETYVIDLDTLGGLFPQIDDDAVNILTEHSLESLVPKLEQQIPNADLLEQIALLENLSPVDENTFMPTETWAENETYAIDINDLSLAKLMGGIGAEVKSPEHLLADLDSSLFPIIGGEDRTDYDLDTDDSSENPQPEDLMPTYDTNATNTSLMAAVIDGDLDLVKQSIEVGANLDCYDWNLSYAPLGMAIDRGYAELVECLLTAGANPHCGSTTTTALGLAAERGEVEIIQLLLARRVDVNAPVGADGWTALLSAIQNGHRSVVRILVAAGANVNVWSRGETPILLAAKCEEREIYNYLYPLVNTAIRLCADRDGEQLLQATHKRRIRQQNRPVEKLVEMATIGNKEEIERAIEIGIEIDALGAQGHTALMAAAYYGHRSIVKLLLAAGADPNLLSDDDGLGTGMTALMLAAGSFFASHRQQLVKLLINSGADPNQRGVGGKTAIFYGALAGSGYADCVETLISAGADLDLRDDRGYTVLTAVAAAENYPMLNLLMQAGASTAGLESIQLIQAAGSGNVDRVKSLLSTKVNLNFERGAAIGNAAAAGHTEIVKLLIQAGANVNLRDKLGFTPIASAAYLGYGEIVNLLIAAGADIQAPAGESQSYSALEYAQMGLYRAISPAEKLDRRNRLAAVSDDSTGLEILSSHQRDNLQHAHIVRQLEQLGSH